MKVLALNTAFSNSDVALKNEEKSDYISFSSSAKHSENILVCVDNILKNNNLKIQDIDTFCVVVGPGSFTGIRIGVGIVKGMYVAKPNIKLVSICSLDLMAHTHYTQTKESEFWCTLDALSGNIFVCKYKDGKREMEPTMLCGDELEKLNGTVVGLKQENLGFCNIFVEFEPKSLLSYAEFLIENNCFVEENMLLPVYLRKSQAEIGLENANKKD